MPEWRAYHGRTSDQHQNEFNSLSSQGFRIISLSVYGDPSNPRYAAVWVRRPGPAYMAFHGKSPAEYQQIFNQQTANGFRPMIVSATGGGALPAIFAGVFEAGPEAYSAVHGVSGNQLSSQADAMHDAGLAMRWLCMYGDPINPLYAGVWEENKRAIGWSLQLNDDSGTYQQKFDAYNSGRMRPVCVSVAGNRLPESTPVLGTVRYASLWYDDLMGSWVAFHNLTGNGYQEKFNEMTARGFMPIHVQAGGDWNNPKFAAVFAHDDQPYPRAWNVRGQNSPGLEAFDQVMHNFMSKNGIRAGQLAVTRRGRLVYNRGFTNAEAGVPITEATSVFRAASVSKTITATAIYTLVEQHHLTTSRLMQEILRLRTPSGDLPPDDSFNHIQLWHLLSHCSGLNQNDRGEPLVAQAFNTSLPVTRDQLARFIAARQLDNLPGVYVLYNNIGFFMLGQVITTQSGVSYEQYVQEHVFGPMGVTRAKVAPTPVQNALPGEVWYQPSKPGVSRSVLSADRPWVPDQYGGETRALGAAMGGWAFAAADYARLWAAFDIGANNPILQPQTVKTMWTNPGGMAGGEVLSGWWLKTAGPGISAIGHNGAFGGSASMLWRRSDGISAVVLFNRDIRLDFFAGVPLGEELNQAMSAVGNWPTNDLFPSAGLASICDDGWRWCHRCQGLFRLGGSYRRSCPAGPGGHSDAGSASYTIVHDLPAARGQRDWRRCKKCEALFYAGANDTGRCPVSSNHRHVAGPNNYVLAQNEPPASPGQDGWRWCSRCQSLWYSGNGTSGACAAGPGGHSGANSGNYLLLMF